MRSSRNPRRAYDENGKEVPPATGLRCSECGSRKIKVTLDVVALYAGTPGAAF
jgi:hypothetical protein